MALVDQHAAALPAWTRYAADDDNGDHPPLWDAYSATLDACHATPATTLVGLIEGAYRQGRMATHADGAQQQPVEPVERLTQSIVHDLVRIHAAT